VSARGLIESDKPKKWVYSIGIRLFTLDDPNPPVYYVVNGEETENWMLSHGRISDYLDCILFGHAFALQTLNGAYGSLKSSNQDRLDRSLVKEGFNQIILNSSVFGLFPQIKSKWPIYFNESMIISVYQKGIAIKAVSK